MREVGWLVLPPFWCYVDGINEEHVIRERCFLDQWKSKGESFGLSRIYAYEKFG